MNFPAEQFTDRLSESSTDGTFVRLVLSRPNRPADSPEKVLARCVSLKGSQNLSLTFRYPTKDITKNMPLAAGIEWVKKQIGREFRSALLCTTQRDWQLAVSKPGQGRLVAHKPSIKQAPSRDHDQSRREILDPSAQDWLHGLGVTDASGKVRERMADKHRQINRYLEILTHLAADCGWRSGAPLERALTIADMGSGKGYLTFGVWHLFRRAWGMPIRVIGVEAREELTNATAQLALGMKAEGLEFIAGTIDSVMLPPVDALIALHACDTATDHAIRRGIDLNARLILVAPCCHKEVRPQIGHPPPLAPVLRHGVMEERMAEWATDGLRALFLEWAGYHTKIFEFISTEHTAKNLMISAVRDAAPFTDASARERIAEWKSFFGIKQHALDSLLGGV